MKRLLAASMALILGVGVTACGTEPTGPENDLVGTWVFEGTDLIDILALRLENLLVAQGVSRTDAKAYIDEAVASTEEYVRDFREIIRYNADNTWKDNSGNKGTWRIQDGTFITTDAGGNSTRLGYFLDGDDLTFIFAKEQLLAGLRQAEDLDAEVYDLYNVVLEERDVVRFFFKRKS